MARISTQVLIDVVSSEGLGYAVTDYCAADKIEDPHLAALWQSTRDAMRTLDTALRQAAEQLGVEHE